jgi:hypothetical protein
VCSSDLTVGGARQSCQALLPGMLLDVRRRIDSSSGSP